MGNSRDLLDNIASVAGPVLVVLLVGGAWAVGLLGLGAPKLELVASASRDTSAFWHVRGRVIIKKEGAPVVARVWGIAVDNSGNRFSPPAVLTSSSGEFDLAPFPVHLTDDTAHEATDVTMYATARMPADSNRVLQGQESVRLSRFGRTRWVEPSPAALLSIGLIFVITILVGLIQFGNPSERQKRTKYYILVALSFLFTFTMIASIAIGLRNVNVNSTPDDVMSLGFANVYQGTYIKDQPPEWLFSLTAPSTSNKVTTGFGAPLWVLLLAVLGAGIFTIALLVKHVTNPVNYTHEDQYRARIGELVQHQFYIFFSPLGAVIVYQLLVAAGAASAQVTVALAVLAAGVALNLVLDKAVKTVQGVLK